MARNRRSRKREGEYAPLDVERMMLGSRTTIMRGGSEWVVQPIGSASAVKVYTCPGCAGEISPGTAHVVAWRADGIMGEAADLADRRHWHSHCWKVAR